MGRDELQKAWRAYAVVALQGLVGIGYGNVNDTCNAAAQYADMMVKEEEARLEQYDEGE